MTIGGRKHWIWCAVDQDGYMLDEIVHVRRNTNYAKRLLIRLMKKQVCVPKRIVTDKLVLWCCTVPDHACGRASINQGVNNQAENSQLPLRKRERERVMQRFRSPGTFQRFIGVYSAVRDLFVPTHLNKTVIDLNYTDLRRLHIGRAWLGSRHDHFEPVNCALVPVNLK